jgi:hypothetical protein
MAAIVRPKQPILFSDRPRGVVTADLLDAQIHNLVEAIHSTQQALEDIRRDDGKLKNNIIGRDQLVTELKHSRQEIDSVEQRTHAAAQATIDAAARTVNTIRDVDLRARDAEAAAVSAASMLSAISHGNVNALDSASDAENSADRAESAAISSENWANHSLANSDNAIAAKNEATQWAEYLAGPVVNPEMAPEYISKHPFGHGLYYQPVEGGLAGLWSAKWWALYAQQLVGHWNFYYLGAWAQPPMPGSTNPETGLTTPSPLLPGSFYYNTDVNQLYIWDGTQWVSPIKLTPAYQSNYVYVATAGQKTFSGADYHGNIPLLSDNDTDVHLNGIRLVGGTDYTVDKATNSLTLTVGATANSMVQWDLLVEASQLAPGAISVFKIKITPVPDGTNKNFTMTYPNPTLGDQPVAATQVAEVAISIDGIVQEPAVDFSTSANTLTFSTAPQLGCRIWGTWHASDIIIP